jgi:hypothetical protein
MRSSELGQTGTPASWSVKARRSARIAPRSREEAVNWPPRIKTSLYRLTAWMELHFHLLDPRQAGERERAAGRGRAGDE